ncbi:hypothetical protein QJS10_CPA01g01790 [Acorus calamus]|uniref:Aminotransferase-like plant mobile domain-containing protein n=1 Tax=Acorus calamus TaxID=4465 RepID=A0AAV9FMS3_ACOCL|nr:hypothetical protein QJS10_CPA01g01790 [Acorus calamus]
MRKILTLNPKARKWFDDVPPRTCVIFYNVGRRYGIMTANKSESMNNVLKGVQGLLITSMTNYMKLTMHMVQLRHWELDPRIVGYVKAASLYYLMQMGYTRCDRRLLMAWIERWRPETNTFHLRQGEMTITLEDVAVLTGLPIDDWDIIGRTGCID